MSCKYCNIEKYKTYLTKKILTLDDGYYTSLYMIYDGKDKKFSMVAEGDGKAEIKINYWQLPILVIK